MKNYKVIRDENKRTMFMRSEEVRRCPDILKSITELEVAKKNFTTSFMDEESYRLYMTKVKEARNDVERALAKNGYSPDYLDPIYTCDKCEDTGVIYISAINSKRCTCNIEEADYGACFDDFNFDLFSKDVDKEYNMSPYQAINKIHDFSVDYCNNFPNNPKQNVLFFGSSGLGKSFVAACMCQSLSQKGVNVIMINAFSLMEQFKDKHVNEKPYDMDYFNCDFLCIDDLGTEPIYKNITVNYLFSLINHRLEHKLATLIVTNLEYEHCVKKYDERVASRIFDSMHSRIIPFMGENLRLKRND